MKRIMMITAYDGTHYHGWQIQPGVPTIEGVLNEKLSFLLDEKITVTGASRTDAGVHAFGNVAVFDADTKIPADRLPFALNRHLPEDIRIQRAIETKPAFHPRKCACRKTYSYKIYNARMQNPLFARYCHHEYRSLDLDAMRLAAGYLVGRHDFKSFCAAGSSVEDTNRVIYGIEIQKEGQVISIHVTGNGFLYHMVRIIAGTLIKAGTGGMKPEAMGDILAACDRRAAGVTAPAKGLVLNEILFELSDFMKNSKIN